MDAPGPTAGGTRRRRARISAACDRASPAAPGARRRHDLAVARERLDVLPHPPVEVVLVQLGAHDGLVHLAQLAQGEGLGQEAVGVGMDVDVAVADLVALPQRLDRGRDDLVVVEEQARLAGSRPSEPTGTRSPVASSSSVSGRDSECAAEITQLRSSRSGSSKSRSSRGRLRSEGSMPTLRRRTSSTVRSTVQRSRMNPPGSERPSGSRRSCTRTRSSGIVSEGRLTVSTATSTVTPGRGNESRSAMRQTLARFAC